MGLILTPAPKGLGEEQNILEQEAAGAVPTASGFQHGINPTLFQPFHHFCPDSSSGCHLRLSDGKTEVDKNAV